METRQDVTKAGGGYLIFSQGVKGRGQYFYRGFIKAGADIFIGVEGRDGYFHMGGGRGGGVKGRVGNFHMGLKADADIFT